MTNLSLLATRWHQWAWDGRRDPSATIGAASLTIVAAFLLVLALLGAGRDLAPWTVFRLVMLGLLAVAVLGASTRHTALIYPLAGVLATVVVTSVGSVRLQSSVDQVIIWMSHIAVFLLVASTISNLRTARRFVDAAVFSGGVLSLVAMYWFWGAGNPVMRWYSTFYWPNPFAGFLLLVLPVEVLRSVFAVTRREAVTHGAMTVLLGTAFILAFSRGAWLTAAVAAGLAAIVLRTLLHRVAVVRAVVLLLAVAAAVFFLTGGQAFRSSTSGVLARATSTAELSEYSLQGRLNFWRGAAEIFRDHPLVGTGPGTYAYVYPQYQRDVRFYAQDPHSLYAQMAAETGVVGLTALLWLMGALAAMSIRVIRASRGTQEFPWVAGAVLGLGAFWFHTGMEMNWSFPAAPAMAFGLMGVLAWYDSSTTVRPEPIEVANGAQGRPIEGRRPRWTKVLAAGGIAVVIVVVALQYAAASQFRIGRAAFAAGRWQPAADSFAQASTLNPLDSRYPSALAEALAKTGRSPATLIPFVRRASALDRATPYYWMQLALLTAQESTPEAARQTEEGLRTAIALDPFHYPEAYQYLAALYRRRGDPAKALGVYRQAAERYPDSVAQDFVLRPRLWPGVLALFMDWASFLTDQRLYGEAEEVYSRILRNEPAYVPAHAGLALLRVKTGRPREAARALEQGLSRVPGNRDLLALRLELRARFPDAFR